MKTTTITALVPRTVDEVKGMADWYGLAVIKCRVCYPDGIEAYKVELTGTPVQLNEYLETTDGEVIGSIA